MMKKRILYIIGFIIAAGAITFAVVFNFPSSEMGKTPDSSASEKESSVVSVEKKKSKSKDKEKEEKKGENAKDTLLIYMVGSDLEARSGAGTDDLKEIEQSGIDLEKANVIVMTGGTPQWHNDLADKEKISILELTKKGFKTVSTTESVSMGSADCLAEFLSYGHKNYPSESFSLVMWDHGNGPVIGYGKDMLFDNDSLTLSEMKAALSKSPFNSQNKLDWVGFDACLMSSAELACVWDDYAHYMVASQEVEPSFGWNYTILKDFSSLNTEAFLSKLIDGYLEACTDYYTEKGYENRDTTLSCMKLSYAAELEEAINLLFERATEDVDTNYNTLVKRRVSTRALGRASTGSEYDLIDLRDMALQLETVYPEECGRITAVLETMIIKNGTNAQNCCGMSFYYPFYNKYYFENSWQKIYSELGAFDDYSRYLTKYQEIWLNDDKLESYASSNMPRAEGADEGRSGGLFVPGENVRYTLQLTPMQNDNYADSKFYILEKVSGELYHKVISSENVTNDNGLLTANFSGKAIYAVDNYGKKLLPICEESDTVGKFSRYSLLTLAEKVSEDVSQLLDFHIAVNNENQKITTSALFPHFNYDITQLSGGKTEEFYMDDWDVFNFGRLDYKYLSRYDNGVIRPYHEWMSQSYFSMESIPRKDGINFMYLPLHDGKYYLMFEITDTQGNKYCSELLPIEAKENVEIIPNISGTSEEISVTWSQGDKVKLFTHNGITVYLKKNDSVDRPEYILYAENYSDVPVNISFTDMVFNGEQYGEYTDSVSVNVNSVGESLFGVIPDREVLMLGEVNELYSIVGTFNITDSRDSSVVLPAQKVKISISGEASLGDLSEYYSELEEVKPYAGALAEKQVLYEDSELRVTLMYLGALDSSPLDSGSICYENLSQENKYVKIEAYAVNGYTTSGDWMETVRPGSKKYQGMSLSLSSEGIVQIEELEILLSVANSQDAFAAPEKSVWLPISLKERGTAEKYVEGENIIFEKSGVKIIADSFKWDKEVAVWDITIVNDTDRDISMHITGNDDLVISNEGVGRHQRRRTQLSYYPQSDNTAGGEEISCNIHILDFYEAEVILHNEEVTTLKVPGSGTASETAEVLWQEGEKVQIAKQNGVTVWLMKGLGYDEKPMYKLEVENTNSFKVYVTLEEIIINDDVTLDGADISVIANPNSTASSADYSSSFWKKELLLGAFDAVTSIEGVLSISDQQTYAKLLDKEKVKVTMTGEGIFDSLSLYYPEASVKGAYLGASAKEQILWETESMRATLLSFGEYDTMLSPGYVCFENLSTDVRTFDVDAMEINGITVKGSDKYSGIRVYGGSKGYISLGSFAFENSLEENNITSIESLRLHMGNWKKTFANGTPDEECWATVTLDEKGKAEPFDESGEEIYNEKGIRVLLDSYETDSEDGYGIWNVIVINDSDNDITLTAGDYGAQCRNGKVGAHQRRKAMIYHKDELNVDGLSFKFKIYDFQQNKVLYEAEEMTTLYAPQD